MKNLKNTLLIATMLIAVEPVFAQTNSGGPSGAAGTGAVTNSRTNSDISSGNATGNSTSAGSNNPAAGMNNQNTDTNNSGNQWNNENSYWRNNYTSRPYYNKSREYNSYEPAYRYGVDLYNRNQGSQYNQLDQSQLNGGWGSARGNSNLEWNDAQVATRDAYERMYNNLK